MSAGRRYALISPCRDEEAYAVRTLDSVAAQTIPPALWVIVDDGSTDRTPQILDEYAKKLPYIRVIRRDNRGRRSVGPGVVEAFYAGYESLNPVEFDYICKLDLDLDLPPAYFQTLIERMEAEPRIGTCSGKPYVAAADGSLAGEPCGSEMSVGMSKFYRVACFRQIGGFVRQVMWDGIDCHRCRMLGWIACSWDDVPELRFLHLRPMGSSQHGILSGRRRHGFGQYFMGTGLAYITASAVRRMFAPPYVTGGWSIWWGYMNSMVHGLPRYGDDEFRRFVRRYQRMCLMHGKNRATEMINRETAPRWNPDAAPASGANSMNSAVPQCG